MEIKETKCLEDAIKNKVPSVDGHLTLFTDGFEDNLFDAIDVEFNKVAFDVENTQMFIISKDLKIEETKAFLIEKGVDPERIKVMNNWSEAPLSFYKISIDYLIEMTINCIIKKLNEDDIENKGRVVVLYYSLMRDLFDHNVDITKKPNFTYTNIPAEFENTQIEIKEFCYNEPLFDSYLTLFFEAFNNMFEYFYVNNVLKNDAYYLCKPSNVIEEMMLASFVRHQNRPSRNAILNENDDNRNIRQSGFVDGKDFVLEGYGVLGATERMSKRINLFLNQESFDKGIYTKEDICSLRANAILRYGKEDNLLRKLIKEDGSVSHYYNLKEKDK